MKKLIIFIMTLSMIFTVSTSSCYAKNNSNEDAAEEYIISFESNEIPQITPFATFYGNGGSSKLNYGSSGKTLTWNVKTGETIFFSGSISITLNSTGAQKKSYVLSESGSNIGGTIILSGLKSGTKYKAQLYGTGVGLTGKKYTVVPNAYITFTY